MRILVIEDDNDTAAYLVKGLKETGYTVDRAADGREGLFLATSEKYDAMIVDRMLPGMEGLAIVQSLRAQGNATPVLILSALGQVDDRVRGLQAGGDDYVVKPFLIEELVARVAAVLRRSGNATPSAVLTYADLALDEDAHRVTRDGHVVRLSPTEYKLLLTLVERRGRVQTRPQLLETVWEAQPDIQTRTVDMHVQRLRSKLGAAGDLIETVRGFGYRFRGAERGARRA